MPTTIRQFPHGQEVAATHLLLHVINASRDSLTTFELIHLRLLESIAHSLRDGYLALAVRQTAQD